MKYDRIWAVCLITIGLISIIIGCCNLFAYRLPDMLTRFLSAVALLCVPVLVYATVRKIMKK